MAKRFDKVTKIHLSAGVVQAKRALRQVSGKLRFCLPPAHKSSIKLNVNKFASHAGEIQIPVSVVALPTSQHKVAQLMAQKAKEKCNKVLDFRRNEECFLMEHVKMRST